MGMIINIDEALKQHTRYNVLREPLNKMLQDQQEAWERENPIDLIFGRSTMSTFQETYSSNIGFAHAFAETSDYNVGPIFNTAEGFSATYRTRTFQGGFIITQQTMEDGQVGRVKDDATAFLTRWHGDVVEYVMKSLEGGFGKPTYWGDASNGGRSKLVLNSADTTDGEVDTPTKNPLFTSKHTIVKREGMTDTDITNAWQSNLYYVDIDLNGDDAGIIPKLADAVNQVITNMENYKDDNNKRTGVLGAKTIVAPNNAHLKAALTTAMSTQQFKRGETMALNPGYDRAAVKTTPYLLDIAPTANGKGIFIVDKAYNAANHGLEVTERIPLTLNAIETKRPYGVTYDGRQRFDVNCASWRGISYLYIGNPTRDGVTWATPSDFTELVVGSTVSTPVTVVNASEIGA